MSRLKEKGSCLKRQPKANMVSGKSGGMEQDPRRLAGTECRSKTSARLHFHILQFVAPCITNSPASNLVPYSTTSCETLQL
jgi:hypothetical protein